ncbi:MAG TPA: transglycosylase SLT domain-containing protein [Vicinamibacterales bacterium]|nr:transglycosylase SLT domain-containing protein [Vicinamibacterales bacterium]
MISRSMRPGVVLAIALSVLAGCRSGLQSQPPAVTPPPPAAIASAATPAAPVPAEDPVLALIAVSRRHFEIGQQELSIGHLDRARTEFNQAIEVLLRSPYGARHDGRLREHFDGLVDQISAYEVTALAQGDGFRERAYEPASIDVLLELATGVPDAPAPSASVTEQVASDLESIAHDVEIPLNARVLAYVELFQGRLRDWIASGLERGAQYLPMIQNVFRAEGLPLDLAYVPLIESAFKPNAVSRAKATGVWQFMARTALAHGLKRDWYVDERSDPEKSTLAAAKYLRSLHKMFDGDWHLALASYNGGPGRVQRAMQRYKKDDFWSLAARPGALPRETREYVPMILAAIIIARNPAEYGFDLQPVIPPAPDTVLVSRPVDLRRVAEWTGAPAAVIQELNPELRRWTTPVRGPEYELKVPSGTADLLQARLQEADTAEMAALKWYTVRKGETLASIARKLGVSRTNLAEANYLSTAARVATGQKLVIPAAPTLILAANADRPVPVTASRSVVPPDAAPATAPAAQNAPDRIRLVYEVKQGDTLSSVARLFKTTVASLKQWNGLRSDRLRTGARLTVFARRQGNP